MFRPLYLICLILLVSRLPAQNLRVESLTIQNGLSQSYVSALLQDREGFVWIGTKNGLNRYDGRDFQIFTHDPDQAFSIADDQIWGIKEVGDFLLVSNAAGILDFYHKPTHRFYHLPLQQGNHAKPSYTPQLMVDAASNIWLLAGEFDQLRSLCLIRVPPGFWQRLPSEPGLLETLKPEFLPNQRVFSAVMSKDGAKVYYNTAEAVYALDTKTMEQKVLDWPGGTWPVALGQDLTGKLWTTYKNTVSCFDGNGYQVFPSDIDISNSRGWDLPGYALFSSTNELMAIPVDKILSAGRVSSSMARWKIPFAQAMICQLRDSSGNIWVGLNGSGILKVNPDFRQITHLFEGKSIYGPVYEDIDQTIVAISASEPLFYPKSSNNPSYRALSQNPAIVSGLCRISIDKSGNRWIYLALRPKSELIKIGPDGQQKRFEIPVFFRTPGNMLADDQGSVWIAGERSLYQFDVHQETWKSHSLESVFSVSPEIYCVSRTSDGVLWLGTLRGLLEARQDAAGQFSFILHTAETGELRHNAVSSLLPDPARPDWLWIATKGGGLSRMDLKNRTFTHLHRRNGLPNDVLYSILPDGQGNLWLSSNKGIIRYHASSGAIRNFTAADGLQSDEFNTWAYGKGPKGTLMFGGINGLNVFDPERFQDNPHPPAVYITGLRLNNQVVGVGDSTGVLQQAIEYTKEITLSFNQRSLTLSFAALEYTASVKNSFRWILEGAESSWHPQTMEHSATYLNLQPGSYTLKVMAANGDGVWNPAPAQLKIRILPPWYRSVWAYLIYAAIIGGLIYAYIRFRLSQMQLQQELSLEHLNSERLKELDKFKSRVFTNVSHEFRTPLTVILGMAEQLEQQPQNQQHSAVNLIKRNGQNLLRLINQILDLAKLESNALKINFVQGDVLAFVRYAAESMHSLASTKNVLLRVESHVPGGRILMDYDPERLLHILYNLLSNAIKFTPPGGRITLRIETLPANAEAGARLQIQVADTGVGISPEALPHIFDRFFQAENQPVANVGGSGIGLALTQELVKLMGGDISVESKPGLGTTFFVRLPVSNRSELQPEIQVPEKPAKAVQNTSPNHQDLPALLIIEDNPDVVEYLTVCLGGHYRLDFAYNGRSGIERALETIPDLIISDVMMPEKNGFEVCEGLKNDERSSHIPIVLLTAKAGLEDRIAGLRRGADAYLAKPFHPEELRAVLANLLALRQKLQTKYAGSDWLQSQEINLQPEVQPNSPNAAQVPDPEDIFLLKLRTVVEDRLSQADLSVEDLSRILGMSYPVVHRKVTALTGRSLTLYVRSIRLRKARLLLADPSLSISEVAYQTGFNDPKFFSRVFSEEFGMSPSLFRQNPSN